MFSLIRAAISAIPKAAKAVKKAVKKAAKKVKEKVAEVVEDVKETIEELKEEAEEAVGKVFTAARKIANEITSDIVQGLKKKMDNLIASGKRFLNNVKKFGKSVVNGIKKFANWVGSGGGKEIASTAIDFVPIVGNVKAGFECVFGFDPITGRKLETWERAVSGAAILGGPLVKGVKHGTKAAIGIGEGLSNVGRKFVNKVKENFGKAVEKVSSGLKSLGAKVRNIKVPVKVNVLSMSAGNGINIPVGIRAKTKSVKELVQNFKANGTTKGTGNANNIFKLTVDDIPTVKS